MNLTQAVRVAGFCAAVSLKVVRDNPFNLWSRAVAWSVRRSHGHIVAARRMTLAERGRRAQSLFVLVLLHCCCALSFAIEHVCQNGELRRAAQIWRKKGADDCRLRSGPPLPPVRDWLLSHSSSFVPHIARAFASDRAEQAGAARSHY